MNKKVFVALALVALLAVSCKSKTAATTEVKNDRTTTQTSADGEETVTDSFFGLLTGRSRQCTWEMKSSASSTVMGTGMVYAGNGKVRSTVHMEQGAHGGIANAVMKDGKAYSWVAMDGMPTFGFTVDQETAKNAAAQLSDEQKKQSEQWRENMSLRCKPWVVDESQFDLPKDVNFDGGMGGMMQGMMSASGSMPSMKGMPSLDSMKAGKVPTPEEIKAMQQVQLKYQNQVQVGQ